MLDGPSPLSQPLSSSQAHPPTCRLAQLSPLPHTSALIPFNAHPPSAPPPALHGHPPSPLTPWRTERALERGLGWSSLHVWQCVFACMHACMHACMQAHSLTHPPTPHCRRACSAAFVRPLINKLLVPHKIYRSSYPVHTTVRRCTQPHSPLTAGVHALECGAWWRAAALVCRRLHHVCSSSPPPACFT